MRVAICAVVLVAAMCFAKAPQGQAANQAEFAIQTSAEFSAAKRHRARYYRPDRNLYVPGYVRSYRRGGSDPSISPEGHPYRVPEYLRNQCFIDEGYGRFSACSNR